MASLHLGFDLSNRPYSLNVGDLPGPTSIYSRDPVARRAVTTYACARHLHTNEAVAVFTAPDNASFYRDAGVSTVLTRDWETPIALESIANIIEDEKKLPSDKREPGLVIFDTWPDVAATVGNATELAKIVLGLSRALPTIHIVIAAASSTDVPALLKKAASSAVFLGLQDRQTALEYAAELSPANSMAQHDNNFAWMRAGGKEQLKAFRMPEN